MPRPQLKRALVADVKIDNMGPLCIRAFSDLHIDDSLSKWPDLVNLAKRDSDRGIKYAVLIGDTAHLVVPPDLRRFRPSTQQPAVRGVDDWLDASIEFVADKLMSLGYTWLLITPGNHEDEIKKRHGVDVVKHLASRIGAQLGGYSGALDVRVKLAHGYHSVVRILWHHGNWGGELAKGYFGAHRWFLQHDDWDFGLFGHNHASRHDVETRVKVNPQSRKLVTYKSHIVNLSSAVESHSDDAGIVNYAERKGYKRSVFAPALLSVSWIRERAGKQRTLRKLTHAEI